MVETIVRLGARGDGVTRAGRYVAGTAPGDVVGDDGSIEPGPHRARPPCRHFGRCGGCQLQHVDDDSYARFLVDKIGGALAEHGLAMPDPGPDPPPVHLSRPHTRRRASLRAERRGRELAIGFNEGQSNRIVDMRECHVLLPELFALIAPLRALLVGVLPDKARATVTMTRADQGIDVLIAGAIPEGLEAVEAATGFAQRHGLARLAFDDGDGPTDYWLPDAIGVTLGTTAVALPHGAFLQATCDGEATLIDAVRASVGGAPRVADLFAGLGTFALSLAADVTAVEGSRDAAAALAATRRVKVLHRDLFRQPLTVTELEQFDAVVLDPPRAGAREQVQQIAGSRLASVTYVSCNPATFARDARTLVDGGYQLTTLTPVGQFRWSTHVELVAAFVR